MKKEDPIIKKEDQMTYVFYRISILFYFILYVYMYAGAAPRAQEVDSNGAK